MLLEPSGEIHFDSLDMCDAMTHERAAQHGHVGAGHDQFDYVLRLINAARGGKIGSDISIKNSNPMQRQSHVGRCAQRQVWRDRHFLQIDVGLIESIKQNEAIHIERVQTGCDVREAAKVRAEFHRERDLGGSSDATNNVDVDVFDSAAGDVVSRGYLVDV